MRLSLRLTEDSFRMRADCLTGAEPLPASRHLCIVSAPVAKGRPGRVPRARNSQLSGPGRPCSGLYHPLVARTGRLEVHDQSGLPGAITHYCNWTDCAVLDTGKNVTRTVNGTIYGHDNTGEPL